MLSKKVVMEQFFNLNLEEDMREKPVRAYTSVGGTPHLDDTYTRFWKGGSRGWM